MHRESAARSTELIRPHAACADSTARSTQLTDSLLVETPVVRAASAAICTPRDVHHRWWNVNHVVHHWHLFCDQLEIHRSVAPQDFRWVKTDRPTHFYENIVRPTTNQVHTARAWKEEHCGSPKLYYWHGGTIKWVNNLDVALHLLQVNLSQYVCRRMTGSRVINWFLNN